MKLNGQKINIKERIQMISKMVLGKSPPGRLLPFLLTLTQTLTQGRIWWGQSSGHQEKYIKFII